MGLPVRIATALVTGEGLELYVGEQMGLEAIRATAIMIAIDPSALKNESGGLLPGRRMAIFRNNVGDPSDIRKLLDITGVGGLLVDLVGDRATKYFAPLTSDGRTTRIALV